MNRRQSRVSVTTARKEAKRRTSTPPIGWRISQKADSGMGGGMGGMGMGMQPRLTMLLEAW
jgi:hypothetical protein